MRFFKNAFCAALFIVNTVNAQNAPQLLSMQDSLEVTPLLSKEHLLNEVVVVDSRIARKRSASGKSVVKIDSSTLKLFQGQSLATVLNHYAGIEVLGSQTYPGQPLTYAIRGGRSDKVLVLIDGVRVSDPSFIDSSFDLNLIPVDNIQSVEILKGASSTLYGSAAAAGVISIQTKKGTATTKLTWLGTTGTLTDAKQSEKGLTTVSNHFSYANRIQQIGYRIHFDQQYSDGMSAVIGNEKDPFARRNFGVRLSAVSSSAWDWDFNLSKTDLNSHYDNSYPLEDAPFRLLSDQLRWSFSPQYRYAKGRFGLHTGYQKSNRDFQSNYPSEFSAFHHFIDLFNTHRFSDKWALLTGINYQKAQSQIDDQNPSASQTDLYLNSIYEGSKLHLNTGLRRNDHQTYGTQWTYNFNPSLHHSAGGLNYKFFLGLSSAFIAPSLYQLYSPYGDESLEPAETQTTEIGGVMSSEAGTFEGVFFKRKENPSLLFDNTTFRYANSNEQVAYSGFEFRYQNSFMGKINTDLNYTYTETEGGDLRRIPKHSFSGLIAVHWTARWFTQLAYRQVGSRRASDGSTLLSPYGLWNINVAYALEKPKLDLGIALTNLFNKKYVEFQNYTTQGRNILLTLRWELL